MNVPSLSTKLTPKWVCPPLPATPCIGFALKVTSSPFIVNISSTTSLTVISLSAAWIGLSNFQDISSCSIACLVFPSLVIELAIPPTSLCAISGHIPIFSNFSNDCSKQVLIIPWVLFQYCSFKLCDTDNCSKSALSSGVFTQNSNSVAEVKTISSISFTLSTPMLFIILGYSSNIPINDFLKFDWAFLSIPLDPTLLLSCIKRAGILSVPTARPVSGSIFSKL